MILDIIGILLIIISFIRGYMKGVILAAFSVLAIVLGVICALKLSHTLAVYLYDKGIITSGWAQIVSYVVLFIIVVLLVRLIAKAIQSALEAVLLGTVNKIVGGILYAALGAFAWSVILWIGTQSHIISEQAVVASKTYHFFAPIAPWVFARLGSLIPFVKNILSELEQFFQHVNQQMPHHVGTS